MNRPRSRLAPRSRGVCGLQTHQLCGQGGRHRPGTESGYRVDRSYGIGPNLDHPGPSALEQPR